MIQTHSFVRGFLAEWCRLRGVLPFSLLQMSDDQIDGSLRRFYGEARTKNGEEYSRSSLLGFRSAVERHLVANDRHLKIAHNPRFARSNKILESTLKLNRKDGKQSVEHKPIIEESNIHKLQKSPFLSYNTAVGLLRRVWFIVTLYWCRRGCEGQRELRRESLSFHSDADGQKYGIMTHNERTKNHQGRITEKSSHEKETRLYSRDRHGDSYWCLEKYLSKLNPKQQSFYQHPKPLSTSLTKHGMKISHWGSTSLER